jgi:SNF2 family DNA or RNA helicase
MRYSPYDRRVLIGYTNIERVQEILASFSVRHLKKEILDLPPVTFQTRFLDWEPKQKVIYKQMVDDYMVELDDSFLEATNAAARMVRLHQILTNPQQLGLDADSTRWKVIEEDLEAIDLTEHKVVILCHYRASVKRLMEQLKRYNPACIYGGTSDVEREKEKFDNDKTCRLMIAHPLSAGIGVNFTIAAYMIFFEYSWDLDSYDQTVSRCNRPGQIYPLTVLNYAVRGGMEERKILPKLVSKKDFAVHLLNDPKEFIEFIKLEEDDELTAANF